MKRMLKNKKGIFGLSASVSIIAVIAAVIVISGLGWFIFSGSPENGIVEETMDAEEVGEVEGEVEATYQKFKESLEDDSEYEVEYEYSSGGIESNVVIYSKGENVRIEDIDNDFTAWVNGETIIEAEGQCFDLDMASQFGLDPESIYETATVEGSIETEDEYASVSSIGTKTIAGQTTECYEFTYRSDIKNQKTTYCLSEREIPALIETEDATSGEILSRVEAKTLEDSVSDEVMKPCEPDMDISGLI